MESTRRDSTASSSVYLNNSSCLWAVVCLVWWCQPAKVLASKSLWQFTFILLITLIVDFHLPAHLVHPEGGLKNPQCPLSLARQPQSSSILMQHYGNLPEHKNIILNRCVSLNFTLEQVETYTSDQARLEKCWKWLGATLIWKNGWPFCCTAVAFSCSFIRSWKTNLDWSALLKQYHRNSIIFPAKFALKSLGGLISMSCCWIETPSSSA